MKKLVVSLLALVFIFPKSASANFVSVNPKGEIVYSVLSASDELSLEIPKSAELKVKEVAKEKPSSEGIISLSNADNKISMSVDYGSSKEQFSFSQSNDELIQIEERPAVQQLSIGLDGDKFTLVQRGITALTNFPISVNSKTAKITVTTERGDRIVSVLPYGAVESLLKAKILSNVNENKLDLVESDSELAYHVVSAKLLNLLDVYSYSVPVSAYVSASTGEVVKVEAPIWFRFIDFIFP